MRLQPTEHVLSQSLTTVYREIIRNLLFSGTIIHKTLINYQKVTQLYNKKELTGFQKQKGLDSYFDFKTAIYRDDVRNLSALTLNPIGLCTDTSAASRC